MSGRSHHVQMGVGQIATDANAASVEQDEAGDLKASLARALDALEQEPDRADLLRAASRAALELAVDDAVPLLRRLTAQQPQDAGAWRDLGLALLYEGDPTEARTALSRALELAPDDREALTTLAHLSHVLGDSDEAARLLSAALEQDPADVSVRRSLLEVYRSTGRVRDAVAQGEALLDYAPDDVLTLLALGDLHLAAGEWDAARAAFDRVRRVDTAPGHAAFGYHGMIEVEVRRGNWRHALDLAIAATTVDRHQLTTDVLAFVTARLFGEADRPAPPWEQVEADLAAERAEHRRLHLEELAS